MLCDISVGQGKKLWKMLSEDQKLTEEEKEQIRVGSKVLGMVIHNLGRKYAFTGLFLNLLVPVPVWDEICLETNGRELFFSPKALMDYYRERNLKRVEDQLLHIILHGILGHFSMRDQFQNREVMDCCMDLEVFQMLLKVNQLKINTDELNWQQHQLIRSLKEGKVISARKGYQKMASEDVDRLSFAKQCFIFDHHDTWSGDKEYHLCVEISFENSGFASEQSAGKQSEISDRWNQMGALVFGQQDHRKDTLQQALKCGAKTWGKEAGGREEMYRADSCQGRTYLEVLEELFRYHERFLEQEDSMDKTLYLYGLQEYGKVALIEPEEYKEVPVLSNVVIALDTSGSCSGRIMSRFIREIGNLLRDVMAKGEFEHIHLLQCDKQIQKVECFRHPEDIPKEMELAVKGFGGTDFRPVFHWVEEQKKEDWTPDLLLYLTDGFGDYPDKEPGYPVYFVLTERSNRDMPKWIKKLYLQGGM